jgi:hypothetical protein
MNPVQGDAHTSCRPVDRVHQQLVRLAVRVDEREDEQDEHRGRCIGSGFKTTRSYTSHG